MWLPSVQSGDGAETSAVRKGQSNLSVDQPLVLRFANAVGAGGKFDQTRPVHDVKLIPRGPDNASPLQLVKRLGDPLTSHTNHQGDEFMGDHQVIAGETVVGHENPARQALLDRGMAIGKRGLAGLNHEDMGVAQQ